MTAAEKQAEADAVRNQLVGLNADLEAAAERYYGALDEQNAARTAMEAEQVKIDEATAQIERKIRKNKTRLAKNLRAEAVLPELPEEFEAHEEGAFDIVRTKRFTVKPMSVEEAILQMNLLGHSFFVFRNTDFGDAICVVYRRNNGGYGIIETEDDEE